MSSRRAGVTIEVVRELCFGFGDCVDSAPERFELDPDGIAHVVDPESHDFDGLPSAAGDCPVDAIVMFDAEPGVQRRP